MNTTAIEKVNIQLKNLSDSLIEEIEKYLEFLIFKYNQENQDIQEWHKNIVLDRIENPKKSVDAFEMIDALEE
jgi:hypothetical protein